MSWQALSWAGKLTVGSPAAKSLLILLANFADEAGECYPTFEKLSEMSELSYRAVQDNIGKLEKLGLIARTRKRNPDGTLGVTRYTLCLDVETVTSHRQEMPVEPVEGDAGGPPADNSTSHRQELPVKYNHQDNHQLVVVGRAGEVDHDLLEAKLRKAAGNEREPSPGLFDLSAPIRLMRDERCDLEFDILPTVRRVAGGMRQPLRSWGAAFLVKEILATRDRREAGFPQPEITGGKHERSSQGAIINATLDRIAEQFGSGGGHAPPA